MHAVCTHIGNQSLGAMFSQIHAFIKLLGQHHSLFGGKTEFSGGFLLQCGSGKRWGRHARDGFGGDATHGKI